jgi:hypothetical protein
MRLCATSLNAIKFQESVVCRTMFAFTDITNLNVPDVTVLHRSSHRSSRKPHRIPAALLRKPTTAFGVAEVAELLQFFVRRNLALMSGGGTVATPTAPQREPGCMQPRSIL